ncbi:hypothetical protein OpiT1DRAFT_05671 [Opitutaceae bacterium TAV1]|nr:hypothetical protein OpiT1DRAFT_05671 [Opitutaceae bacterium TAV1]
MKTRDTSWKPCRWPYNDSEFFASWQCYERKFGRGRVILHPSVFGKGQWAYVASFGANSPKSFSGGFPDGFTLEQAKAKIQQIFLAGKF